MVDLIMGKMKDAEEPPTLAALIKTFIMKISDVQASASEVVQSESTDNADPIFDPTANVIQQTLSNHAWILGASRAKEISRPCREAES